MTNGWVSPSGPGNDSDPAPGYSPPPQYPSSAPPPVGEWQQQRYQPGVIPLRPLDLGDIFQGAVATVRGNPVATIGLSLIVGLIGVIPLVIITSVMSVTNFADSNQSDVVALIARMLSYPIQWLAGLILSGLLIVVLSEAILGRRLTIGTAWRRTRPAIWRLLGVAVLVFLITAGPLIVVIGAAIALSLSSPTAAILLGVLGGIATALFAVFMYVRTMFAVPVAVLEKCRPVTSIRRSFALSRNQFWRIFGIHLLAQLALGAVSGVLAFPITLIAGTAALSPAMLTTVTALVTAVVGALVAPFVANVTGLQYIDQRIRKEALDVTLANAAT